LSEVPPFFIGLGVFLPFVIASALGLGAPESSITLVFLLIALMVGFGAGFVILIGAFMDSIVQGILTMFIPFYVLYWLLARCESALVKSVFAGSFLGYIVLFSVFLMDPAGAAGATP